MSIWLNYLVFMKGEGLLSGNTRYLIYMNNSRFYTGSLSETRWGLDHEMAIS
jgi:hypothetical protein